jgi:hypothetical protein
MLDSGTGRYSECCTAAIESAFFAEPRKQFRRGIRIYCPEPIVFEYNFLYYAGLLEILRSGDRH